MVTNFTEKDKQDLRAAAIYAAMLPPKALWEQFKKTLADTTANEIEMYWDWLGSYLDIFFADEPNPFPNPNSSASWQALIEVSGTYYIQLAIVIFQSEHFLKAEFTQHTGLEYPFKRRSDLLKCLMLENCMAQLELCVEGCVSPSAAQWLGRLHTVHEYMNEEISESRLERSAERALKEDSKRNSRSYNQGFYFWNPFCMKVFRKYKRKIPNYFAYTNALKGFHDLYTSKHSPRCGEAKQIAAVNGQIITYPGRGKGKKSKSSS